MKKNLLFSNQLIEVLLVDLDHNRPIGNESDTLSLNKNFNLTVQANHYVLANNIDSTKNLFSIISK